MAFYDTVRLEKGMYNTPGKSFTQVLEELDPSASYENTEFAGLDAYQRQLKRFDIKVGGRGSDVVEKFFQSTDSAASPPIRNLGKVKDGVSSRFPHFPLSRPPSFLSPRRSFPYADRTPR